MTGRTTIQDVESNVRDAIRESIAYDPSRWFDLDDATMRDDASDEIHEHADGAVPVYYSDLAACLDSDNSLAAPDDPGLLPESADVWQILQVSIYERASAAGHEHAQEIADYLEDFVPAYLAALVWSERPDDAEEIEAWGDTDEDAIDNLSAETRERIHRDAIVFVAENWHALDYTTIRDYDASQAGHDFALTRNRHGAGYWDRDEINDLLVAGVHGFERWHDDPTVSVASILTDAADAAGEFNLYASDDGEIVS